ncbi:YbjN domain-containing protein [Schaalia hyovaginalis]|uniref:YbjN domain-containing protein n=1 Tax=Schaalia hyovaginalis TaxID=29316 RepID=A0A923E944_9ACTO|nr:YbjN domain-containing protein [Schaalia hyovaginalis]MBB6335714.1 hypothetical protein [Schaalia hyovaginalis]MCI7671649.1 YbjN domain-containing protein [Schaalia hyovaginalis]MDY2669213.1 YbjN domain-containing protein [Schaalia hyovaginalis]MDY5506744.1 YbjN domain-containing protein [Schaalia hyovaginalis]
MPAATPVNTDRIRAMLSDRDVSFGEYDEAELAVPTLNAVYFWDTSNPQILQLRAQWRGIATTDAQFAALVEEVAKCNSMRTGPKAYLAPFEDGKQYGLIAECNVIATDGLTPAQLDSFCETSMTMIMGFLADLEDALPDFVDWRETDADEEPRS